MISALIYISIFHLTLYRTDKFNLYSLFLITLVFDIFTFRFVGSSFFPIFSLYFLTGNMKTSLQNLRYPFVLYYFAVFLLFSKFVAFLTAIIFNGVFVFEENLRCFLLTVSLYGAFFLIRDFIEKLGNGNAWVR